MSLVHVWTDVDWLNVRQRLVFLNFIGKSHVSLRNFQHLGSLLVWSKLIRRLINEWSMMNGFQMRIVITAYVLSPNSILLS